VLSFGLAKEEEFDEFTDEVSDRESQGKVAGLAVFMFLSDA